MNGANRMTEINRIQDFKGNARVTLDAEARRRRWSRLGDWGGERGRDRTKA